MITSNVELNAVRERINWFQDQFAQLRSMETNSKNYQAAVAGFLAEIDRMQLEVREYLSFLPSAQASTV